MIPAICIFGPTASGKSGLALRLAKEFGGTIISADSMHIYRRMDVGTAKPTREEQRSAPHKMIDICDPEDDYSVYDYQRDALFEIENAWRASSLPVVVGGTGLYVDALLFNTAFGEMEIDPSVRERLHERAAAGEGAAMLEELRRVDPETALPLHEKDLKRIVRALEVWYSTGETLSAFKARSHEKSGVVDFLTFNLLFRDRAVLYARIDRRVDEMMNNGLLEETKTLLREGVFSRRTASQAIGYKELIPFLEGEKTLEECVSTLKQKTRNYAKRQITWFKRYTEAVPLYMDGIDDPYSILAERSGAFLKRYES
ncbi:MAG: tRNA (adenosine(37)-N6)-dimethylallyltransferase MiaA [Clostridia bacterium]|nr:tRNA (adenosine(37)-N6)-dimethylallyltransferase MiaA [Clostridia bacterium]